LNQSVPPARNSMLRASGTKDLRFEDCSHPTIQHPPRPAISAIWADPPSVVGTGGGQMVPEEWLAIAAVVAAACEEEVSCVSPGNCKGTCERFEDDALIPDVLPPAEAVGVPPSEPVKAGAGRADLESVGKVEVGTPSGSLPTRAAGPTPLWIACAWAPANPNTMAAISKVRRIAISRMFLWRQRARRRKRTRTEMKFTKAGGNRRPKQWPAATITEASASALDSAKAVDCRSW